MTYTEVAAGGRINASTINDIIRGTLNKPAGRLVATSTQALADNTQVAILFGSGSTVFDTHAFHSESSNTSRVTPNVAGVYRISGTGFFATQATPNISDVCIRKNGSTNQAAAWRYAASSTQAVSGITQIEIEMNGSTDYFELVMRQDSAGADDTNQSSQFSSALEWEYVRSLTT